MTAWLDPTILALGLAVGIGAFVQSSIGFGIAVVSAPLVVVVEPQLMPVSLMVCAIFLPFVQLTSGPREISWQPLGWSLVARLLATPLGIVIVAVTSADAIALIVGVLILLMGRSPKKGRDYWKQNLATWLDWIDELPRVQ